MQSESELCRGTLDLRKAHAEALVQDNAQLSAVTGAELLGKLKAGCRE